MSTTADFVEYICEQVNGVGNIRYKKMFGEYMVYINEKPVLLVCDNTPYIKMLDCISELMKNAETGYPYKGSKEHYILDIDNSDFAKEIVTILEKNYEVPKKKAKKAK